jgi:hypothetical protein
MTIVAREPAITNPRHAIQFFMVGLARSTPERTLEAVVLNRFRQFSGGLLGDLVVDSEATFY